MKLLIKVGSDEDRNKVAGLGGAILADYGHTLLVELEQDGANRLAAEGLAGREAWSDPTVKVNGYRLNTAMGAARPRSLTQLPPAAPVAAAAEIPPQGPEGKSYYVVQVVGPMHPDWLQEFNAVGAKVYSSLGNNAYLVGIDASRVAELTGKPFIASVSEYLPQLKISQQLLTPEVESRFVTNAAVSLAADLGNSPTARALRSETVGPIPRRAVPRSQANIKVILFDENDREKVVAALQQQPNVGVVEATDNRILVSARPEAIPGIAAIPEIRDIEPNLPRELHNNVAINITRVDAVRAVPGLTGAGQVIGVADTGLDNGNLATMSLDFRGRVRLLQPLGRNIANDPDGHGTHVAGSILGNGGNSNGRIQGMSPDAELVFQSVLDSLGGLGGLPSNLSDLFDDARSESVSIHNNSWGRPLSNGAYDDDSDQVDDFSFLNRDFLIVMSAGNDGPTSRVTAPGTAKNALTVGASESVRPLPSVVTFPASPRFPTPPSLSGLNAEADSELHVASFSCPGPVENNRRKPDVVAPGSWILSSRSSAAVADLGADGLANLSRIPLFPTGGTGDEDGIPTHAEAVGLGLPGGPILFAGSVNAPALPAGVSNGAAEHYMYQSGTSMASPVTAGCCALIREYFQNHRGHEPSAALIKAAIVNGANNIRTSVPDNMQGWGRVSVVDAILPANQPVQFDDDLGNALSPLQIREYRADISNAAAPISVTLVWRDAPGKTIQNELQLRVFDGNSSTAQVADAIGDIRNNVQKVSFVPTSSFLRIEVEAVNISRGIPEQNGNLVQDFALVVGNADSLELH